MENLSLFNMVEQILNRPLNSFDASIVDSWVSKYGNNYLKSMLPSLLKDVKDMRVRVYSTNYIDTYLYRNYEIYKSIINNLGNVQEQKEEKPKVETKETNYKDWDEYPELEREYWVAKLGYTFYPNEYPNPDLNSKYDGINKN